MAEHKEEGKEDSRGEGREKRKCRPPFFGSEKNVLVLLSAMLQPREWGLGEC